MRPDPLVLAGGLDIGPRVAIGASVVGSLKAICRSRPASVALLSMVVSQAAMVGVMTMTPVHMRLEGHESLSHYGGVAGFSSGFIRSTLGYPMLANVATLLAVALLGVAATHLVSNRRAPQPLG